jgi:hypothetical protein
VIFVGAYLATRRSIIEIASAGAHTRIEIGGWPDAGDLVEKIERAKNERYLIRAGQGPKDPEPDSLSPRQQLINYLEHGSIPPREWTKGSQGADTDNPDLMSTARSTPTVSPPMSAL